MWDKWGKDFLSKMSSYIICSLSYEAEIQTEADWLQSLTLKHDAILHRAVKLWDTEKRI